MCGLARREWIGAPHVPLRNRFFGRLPYDLPQEAFVGVDAVIHCAAVSDPSFARSHAINVLGTVRTAHLAREAGVATFVFLSSQSAIAGSRSPYGRSKYEAEQELAITMAPDTVIVRPGLVTGNGGLFARIARTATRSPVIPLLGAGGVVQPIFVGDLVLAILTILETPTAFARQTITLGLESPARLGDLVRAVARSHRRRSVVTPLPLGLAAAALRTAERVGMSLPVNSANLEGLRSARSMSTTTDMGRLGVPRRSLEDVVRLGLAPDVPTRGVEPPRGMLIGAGRIGFVHAVTASRLPGIVLEKVVDRSSRALKLVTTAGVRAQTYDSFEAAVKMGACELAIVATPPASHLSLARLCVAKGMRTLVEKPASISEDGLAAFTELAEDVSDGLLVGYLMPRIPHVRRALDRLRAGEFGHPVSFAATTLVSFAGTADRRAWETDRASSGGGVLANNSPHLHSLIVEAFGPPRSWDVQTMSIVSASVEDSAVVRYEYGGFEGIHYSSWVIRGFPRQENRLTVETDRGRLTVTSTVALFEQIGSGWEVEHQVDAKVGFNLAPDYVGAGVAVELNDLSGGASDPGAMTFDRARPVESLLFQLYRSARATDRFTVPASRPAHDTDSAVEREGAQRLIADLRESQFSKRPTLDLQWHGMLVFPRQLAALGSRDGAAVYVTVPDFLRMTRSVSTESPLAAARTMGAIGVAAAVSSVARNALRSRRLGFWELAIALLAADMVNVPRDFTGVLLIHPYLVDVAVALDQRKMLERLLRAARERCPNARIGFHTNLADEVVSEVVGMERPPDVLSILTSPNGARMRRIRSWLDMSERTEQTTLIGEVGPAPLRLHRHAWREPGRWAEGASALVVDARVDPQEQRAHSQRSGIEWERAFPGVAPTTFE